MPQLLDHPEAGKIFPKDVLARAKLYLDKIGSTGAYTESRGAAICREHIAEVLVLLAALLEADSCGSPAQAHKGLL